MITLIAHVVVLGLITHFGADYEMLGTQEIEDLCTLDIDYCFEDIDEAREVIYYRPYQLLPEGSR